MDNVNQRGQATTEFLIGAIAIVPILLMIPLLGKVSDVNHTAIEASRYAAWETTVATPAAKSVEVLTSETQRRFFEHPDLFIQTGQTPTGSNSDRNPLWTAGAESRLVTSSTQSIGLSLTREEEPGGVARTISDGLTLMAGIPGLFKDDLKFDVEKHGLVTARIGVDVAANGFGFEAVQGCSAAATSSFSCVARQNVILTDAWDAATKEEVDARTKAFVPAAIFEDLTKITDVVGHVPFIKEWGRIEPGYVDSDVVPEDRLGPYEK